MLCRITRSWSLGLSTDYVMRTGIYDPRNADICNWKFSRDLFSRFFSFRIISDFLNLRMSTLVVYKVYITLFSENFEVARQLIREYVIVKIKLM